MDIVKDFYEDSPKLSIFILIIIFLVLFVGLDFVFGGSYQIRGVVQEKHFTPGQTGVGIGPTATPKGTGTTVIVTATSDEYILFVRSENEEVHKLTTNQTKWSKVSEGDSIIFFGRYGKFTKANYGFYY